MGKCGVMSMMGTQWLAPDRSTRPGRQRYNRTLRGETQLSGRATLGLRRWGRCPLFGQGCTESEHGIGRGDLDGLDHGLGRDGALDGLRLNRHAFGQLVIDQFAQTDRIQILDHLVVQAGPQVVGHAAAAVIAHAVFLATAAGGVDGLIDRDGDVFGLAAQGIATARATGALDELVATQLAEQLLKVGQRDLLPLADGSQSDGAGVLPQSQINHGRYSETALGGQTHGITPYAGSNIAPRWPWVGQRWTHRDLRQIRDRSIPSVCVDYTLSY